MNINSTPPPRISALPAEAALELRSPLVKPLIWLQKKGSECAYKLPVLRQTDCTITVLIKEQHADLGAGMFELIAYDGCVECSRTPIEFTAECGAKSASVKQVQDEKDCATC